MTENHTQHKTKMHDYLKMCKSSIRVIFLICLLFSLVLILIKYSPVLMEFDEKKTYLLMVSGTYGVKILLNIAISVHIM